MSENNTETNIPAERRRAYSTAEGVAIRLTALDTRLVEWRQVDTPVTVALWVERLRISCPLTDGVEVIADFLDEVYRHNGWNKSDTALGAIIGKGITNRRRNAGASGGKVNCKRMVNQ